MAVKLPILPSSVCGAFVGSTFSKSGKFCAGGIINVDSCQVQTKLYLLRHLFELPTYQGDSGGPLTLVDAKDGRAYLHGIVSTALPGTTCGSGAFGLYVRVSLKIFKLFKKVVLKWLKILFSFFGFYFLTESFKI